ncbi:hypothetical protein CPA10_23060 (plasmid) [Xanthomonas citri pv. citri]|nr:hypothetical protein CPA10_23060 [Xanthomonas citri pv. citri]
MPCNRAPPSIELFPWRWTLSRPFTFSFIDSQFVDARAGLPSQAPGSSTARPIPRSTLAGRKKVIDPETGEPVSKAALAKRQKRGSAGIRRDKCAFKLRVGPA